MDIRKEYNVKNYEDPRYIIQWNIFGRNQSQRIYSSKTNADPSNINPEYG